MWRHCVRLNMLPNAEITAIILERCLSTTYYKVCVDGVLVLWVPLLAPPCLACGLQYGSLHDHVEAASLHAVALTKDAAVSQETLVLWKLAIIGLCRVGRLAEALDATLAALRAGCRVSVGCLESVCKHAAEVGNTDAVKEVQSSELWKQYHSNGTLQQPRPKIATHARQQPQPQQQYSMRRPPTLRSLDGDTVPSSASSRSQSPAHSR